MATPLHSVIEIHGIIVVSKNGKNKGGLSSVADDLARAVIYVVNIMAEVVQHVATWLTAWLPC